MLPILASLPKSFEDGVTFKLAEETGSERFCYSEEKDSRLMFTKVQNIVNLTSYGTVFVIIVISYLMTWWLLKKNVQEAREIDDGGTQTNIEQVESRRKSLLIAIGLIFVCYIVLRLPLAIVGPTYEIDSISSWLGICVLLFEMQFCTNVIIYAVFMADFREAFLDVFYLMCPCCFKWPRNLNKEDMEMSAY